MPLRAALPSPGAPQAGEVQLWCLALPQLAALAPHCAALLDVAEVQHAARFHFERDRLRHVLVHGVLRHLLGEALGVAAAGLRWRVGAHGKPALAPGAHADLRFNLSHAGDWFYLALSVGCELGVDVERQRPEIVDELLPSLNFTVAELAWINGQSGPARSRAFFAVWARKEAAIKAWGTGLSLALDRFDITPGRLPVAPLAAPAELAAASVAWTVRDVPAAAGYSAALVAEGAPPVLRLCGHDTGAG